MTSPPQPRFWNIWWTLTMISAGFGILVVILELLGIIQEVGMALSVLSILLTTTFGLSAASRSAVSVVQTDVRSLHTDVRVLQTDVRVLHADVRALQIDVRTLHPMVTTLEDIRRILDERLPARPPA